jgi:hypothetical protein
MKRLIFLAICTLSFAGCQSMPSADESIGGAEHWVQSASGLDGKPLKLYVWEKRPTAVDPSTFAKSRKVVLLAHGAGTPGRIAFDLQVSEKSAATYSLMDYLAGQGFDVFAVDYQNTAAPITTLAVSASPHRSPRTMSTAIPA